MSEFKTLRWWDATGQRIGPTMHHEELVYGALKGMTSSLDAHRTRNGTCGAEHSSSSKASMARAQHHIGNRSASPGWCS